MPLVLYLSTTITSFNRIFITGIIKSSNEMFRNIACNKANCHLSVLQPYTKIQILPTTNQSKKPTKPLRLHLTEPLYIDMANNMIPKTSQPTNVTIQQLFNQSSVPIDTQMEQNNWIEVIGVS